MPAPAYKRCMDCGAEKSLDDFYSHPGMRDGRLNRCKKCHVARASAHSRANRKRHNELKRRHAERHPEKVARSKREWEKRNPEKVNAKAKRQYIRHPEKRRARTAVTRAVESGRLTRPAQCESCGRPDSPLADGRSQIEAHHADYAQPLDVEWLCRRCHQARHSPNTRNTLASSSSS